MFETLKTKTNIPEKIRSGLVTLVCNSRYLEAEAGV